MNRLITPADRPIFYGNFTGSGAQGDVCTFDTPHINHGGFTRTDSNTRVVIPQNGRYYVSLHGLIVCADATNHVTCGIYLLQNFTGSFTPALFACNRHRPGTATGARVSFNATGIFNLEAGDDLSAVFVGAANPMSCPTIGDNKNHCLVIRYVGRSS